MSTISRSRDFTIVEFLVEPGLVERPATNGWLEA